MQANHQSAPPYIRTVRMGQGNGQEQMKLPQAIYGYVSINNPTSNTITVYEGLAAAPYSVGSKLGQITPRTSLTIPIMKHPNVTLAWIDGGGTETKDITVTFSVENLNQNTQLGSASSSTVTLTTDAVGLARQNQLPAALHTDGGLKVHMVNLQGANQRFFLGAIGTGSTNMYTAAATSRVESIIVTNPTATAIDVTVSLAGVTIFSMTVAAKSTVGFDTPIVMNAGDQLTASGSAAGLTASASGLVVT